MSKIIISGCQSSGKSTIINKLKLIPGIQETYVFKEEIMRSIKDRGFKINEHGDDDTQLMVYSRMLENYTAPNAIHDRGFLDTLVYTTYLYRHNKVSSKTFSISKNLFENLKYDIYFYIKPEFSLVNDNVRSTNLKFRDDVVELYEYYIDKYKINPIILTGSADERVNQFLLNIN